MKTMKRDVPSAVGVGIIVIVAVFAFEIVSHQGGLQSGITYQLGITTPSSMQSGRAATSTGQYPMAPTSTATTATSSPAVSTSNWKTYTDSQYGISVEYPANWYLNGPTATGSPSDWFGSVPVADYYHGGILPIEAADITIVQVSSTLENAISDSASAQTVSFSGVVVGGVKGVEGDTSYELGPGAMMRELSLFIPHNGFVYEIYFDYRDNPQWIETFNTFLSAFRFIEPSSTTQ